MNGKHMSKSHWAEVAYTIYLMSQYTTYSVHDVTSHEKYYARKLDLSHVRVLGSFAYVHIPDKKWQKLDPKS